MEAVREYDTRLDTKKRLTLRGADFEYYHVIVMENGTILLEPRELTTPFQVSIKTLTMMDEAVNNMKNGMVSEAINLSDFGD